MKTYYSILIFAVLSISCAHEPSYLDQLAQRPMPTTEQEKVQECSWIRSEIANEITKQENVNYYENNNRTIIPGFSLGANMEMHENITALEARAANIGCKTEFSNKQIIENNKPSSINECIKACKENTNRSSEECLDACNK